MREIKMPNIIPAERIEKSICLVRGQKVILDKDLAVIYGVPTFRFNEAVKRDISRFPEDFMSQLTNEEADILISQNAMSKPGRGGRRTLPYAFTEHGAVMVANILKRQSGRASFLTVSLCSFIKTGQGVDSFIYYYYLQIRTIFKTKGFYMSSPDCQSIMPES